MKFIFYGFIIFTMTLLGCKKQAENSAEGKPSERAETSDPHAGHHHHSEEKENEEKEGKEKDGTEHHHDKDESEHAENEGLHLEEETQKAVGIVVEKIAKRKIASSLEIEAQIYRQSGESLPANTWMRPNCAYASGMTSKEIASDIKKGAPLQSKAKNAQSDTVYKGQVTRVDSYLAAALGQVELILEIEDQARTLKVGDFLQVQIASGSEKQVVLAAPKSAVLITASGNFVYSTEHGHFKRIEVTLGNQSENEIEIKEGLKEGDEIVVQGAKQIWLAELKATKGGGHSH